MRFYISGSNIPAQLFELFSALTDHAKLHYTEIDYDEKSGVVILPITRYPLLKQRKTLGNSHDTKHPIISTVKIYQVVSFNEGNRILPEIGNEIQLLFGIQIVDNVISLSSVEEAQGITCYSLTIGVSDYEIEFVDANQKSA